MVWTHLPFGKLWFGRVVGEGFRSTAARLSRKHPEAMGREEDPTRCCCCPLLSPNGGRRLWSTLHPSPAAEVVAGRGRSQWEGRGHAAEDGGGAESRGCWDGGGALYRLGDLREVPTAGPPMWSACLGVGEELGLGVQPSTPPLQKPFIGLDLSACVRGAPQAGQGRAGLAFLCSPQSTERGVLHLGSVHFCSEESDWHLRNEILHHEQTILHVVPPIPVLRQEPRSSEQRTKVLQHLMKEVAAYQSIHRCISIIHRICYALCCTFLI